MENRHIVTAVVLIIAAGAAAWVAFAPSSGPTPAPTPVSPAPASAPSNPTPVARSAPSRAPKAPPARSTEPTLSSNAVAAAPAAPARPDPLDKVAVGREALAKVGKDPEATQLWLMLINDLTISAEARKDLIEDLNEDGFSDPKNPTEEDIPLIRGRLELIQKIAPSAMDDVNARAFVEAHRDLRSMLTRASPPPP